MAEDKNKPTKKSSGTTKPKKIANNEAEQGATESAPSVALQWAVGMVIAALIVGMGVGYTIAPKSDSSVPATSAPSGTSAPALSPDQLKGGKLPAGHPALPPAGETSSTGADTSSPEPTK